MNSFRSFLIFFIFFFLSTSIVNSSEKIVYINIDYVLNNSNLGKIIYKELEKINKENIKNLNEKETLIKQKKDKINKTKNITSKEKLDEEVAIFNKEVEEYKSIKNKLLKDFKLLKEKKLDNFLKKVQPIIQEYMKENKIDIVLEKKQIFIGNNNIDITKDIIKLINTKVNNG